MISCAKDCFEFSSNTFINLEGRTIIYTEPSAHWLNHAARDLKSQKILRGLGGMREAASTSFRVDWGVVGDLDMIAILKDSGLLFDRKSAERDTRNTPMSIDLLIHAEGKLNSIKRAGRLYRILDHEAV